MARRAKTVKTESQGGLAADQAFLAAIVESSDDAIIGKKLDGTILSWNAAATGMYGYTAEEAIGRSILTVVPPDREDEIPNILYKISRGQTVDHYETMRMNKAGRQFHVSLTVSPIRDESGEIVGASTIARDIGQRLMVEDALAKQRVAQAILDISTPVMQVWEGVVCAPLIGTLDSQRTQQLMELLLQRIVETGASVALVDVTGVPSVDTQTARHIIETATAVKLLGGQVILTGIRPVIAQTLVHLGVDLSEIVTRSSLATGFRAALESLDLEIVNKRESR
ncbi:MAG: PAS domain S-box protein [Desulfomonilaceae bacterium]